MKKYFLVCTAACVLVVSGCAESSRNNSVQSDQFTIASSTPSRETNKQVLHLIKLPPGTFLATAEYSASPKTVAQWRSGGEEIIINGGYFHEDYSPSGFLVVQGERMGKRKFDEDKSGIVGSQNGVMTVRDLKTEPFKHGEKFDFAVQSFPFLVEDGKPAIKTISEKRARRTAVGTDKENNFYIISVIDRELSLYEFMQELQKTQIPFVHVLNLDGGPSTGLYMKWKEEEKIMDSIFPVPQIIRFIPK